MDIPQVTLTNHPLSSTLNKARRVTNANRLTFSKDFDVTRGNHGTHIELKRQFKYIQGGWNWQADYDFDKGYLVNDVVRVTAGNTYYDDNGDPAPVGLGLWICVKDVPYRGFKDVAGRTTIAPELLADLVRADGVKYYPINPEPTNPYWQLLVPFDSCV